MKKLFRILTATVLGIIVVSIAFVFVTFPSIMTGMAAKTMCSCVYVAGRTPESVIEKELQVFPGVSKAKIEFTEDSTVTAKLLGTTGTAIFRKGLGCTLLAEAGREVLTNQKINLP